MTFRCRVIRETDISTYISKLDGVETLLNPETAAPKGVMGAMHNMDNSADRERPSPFFPLPAPSR